MSELFFLEVFFLIKLISASLFAVQTFQQTKGEEIFMFQNSIKLISDSIGTAFPCAAVAIGRGNLVYIRKFLGNRQQFPEKLPLTEDTPF